MVKTKTVDDLTPCDQWPFIAQYQDYECAHPISSQCTDVYPTTTIRTLAFSPSVKKQSHWEETMMQKTDLCIESRSF